MYYIMVHKDEQSKMSLVRMGILTLQTMSVESSFGKRLNKEFVSQESLPTPLRINKFHGSYADFLIAVCPSRHLVSSTYIKPSRRKLVDHTYYCL